jgi:protein-tyrosine phosphatase
MRVLAGKMVFYEIIPRLFQSSKFTGKNFDTIEKLKIDIVIDLEGESDDVPARVKEVKCWPILDKLYLPNLQELWEVVEWGASRLEGGLVILTHCAFGRNRSGLVNGEILKRLGWSGPDALARIREVVPGGLANPVFAEYVRTSKYRKGGNA